MFYRNLMLWFIVRKLCFPEHKKKSGTSGAISQSPSMTDDLNDPISHRKITLAQHFVSFLKWRGSKQKCFWKRFFTCLKEQLRMRNLTLSAKCSIYHLKYDTTKNFETIKPKCSQFLISDLYKTLLIYKVEPIQ